MAQRCLIAEFSARCPGSYARARPPLGNPTRSCMCSTSSVRIWWGRAPLPKHVSAPCKMPALVLVHTSTSALWSLCSAASPSFRWWASIFSWFKPWALRFVSFLVPKGAAYVISTIHGLRSTYTTVWALISSAATLNACRVRGWCSSSLSTWRLVPWLFTYIVHVLVYVYLHISLILTRNFKFCLQLLI